MTFLSLHSPALVFREQPGLWGGKGTEDLYSWRFRRLAPKREKRKSSPRSAGGRGNHQNRILPDLEQGLGRSPARPRSDTCRSAVPHWHVPGVHPHQRMRMSVTVLACAHVHAIRKTGPACVGMERGWGEIKSIDRDRRVYTGLWHAQLHASVGGEHGCTRGLSSGRTGGMISCSCTRDTNLFVDACTCV